jgi:hypothetical protein
MWRFPCKVEAMKRRAMKTIYKTIEMIRDYNVFAAVLVPTVLMVLATCVSLSMTGGTAS